MHIELILEIIIERKKNRKRKVYNMLPAHFHDVDGYL